MHQTTRRIKTLLIFILIVLLLLAYFRPDTMHELTAAVTAAFGGG